MPAALTDIQSDEYMRYAENCVKMAKVAINRVFNARWRPNGSVWRMLVPQMADRVR